MLEMRGINNLVLAVDTITLVIGLPANLLALYTFIQKLKQNAKPIDVLLLSLTISDLIFLVFLPFRIKEEADRKWTMSRHFCPVSNFVFYTTIYISTFLLMAISVERYLGVAFPISTPRDIQLFNTWTHQQDEPVLLLESSQPPPCQLLQC
ncbi:free fatty acid receptor 3-like [Electrophorus electricus]|uniref:free fatty acid receptor 3-like n=1 Tax=Electrophorus electricus TaxID=8005 RepID=UPI000F0A51F0|nr:free fatty acid receptor 3-like [Electrophorus electricus]